MHQHSLVLRPQPKHNGLSASIKVTWEAARFLDRVRRITHGHQERRGASGGWLISRRQGCPFMIAGEKGIDLVSQRSRLRSIIRRREWRTRRRIAVSAAGSSAAIASRIMACSSRARAAGLCKPVAVRRILRPTGPMGAASSLSWRDEKSSLPMVAAAGSLGKGAPSYRMRSFVIGSAVIALAAH